MNIKIFSTIRPVLLAGILAAASVSALVFNYYNPEGLTIISYSDSGQESSERNEIEFFKPIRIGIPDAYLLFTKDVQFVDIRMPDEYNAGHIPNSINLPFENINELKTILGKFASETPLVIYGGRFDVRIADIAAGNIFNAGYNRIYIFTEGMDEWIRSGYQVVK